MIDDKRDEVAEARWLTDSGDDFEDANEQADYAIRGERIMREPRNLPVYGGSANAMQAPLPAACRVCEKRAAIVAAPWEKALLMRLDGRGCEVIRG